MRRHSPVVCWLLAAATLAVTAVAIRWLKLTGEVSVAAFLYEALITGQLAVVCLWSVFSAPRAIWGWISVIGAVIAATLLAVYSTRLLPAEAGGIYGILSATLVGALWVFKRTAFWQRISGTGRSGWQYSMAHLLAVTTLLALLVPVLKNSQVLSGASELWRFLIAMTVGDVFLVLGTTIIWMWSRERAWLPHWLPRFGTIAWLAITVGVVEAALARSGILGADVATSVRRRVGSEFVAYTMLMSFVVFLWLELAPIVPINPRSIPSRTDEAENNVADE